jgi:hypothetical protein
MDFMIYQQALMVICELSSSEPMKATPASVQLIG